MVRYALTIFLSAFLLFQIQPIMGKHVLPWFGGGTAIWTTCMLFFQVLLLGGYLYAHLISVRLRTRWQGRLHLALLLASLALLPITPTAPGKALSGGPPAAQILLLLLVTVGFPYFLLSTTGPLMQRWFSRSFPGRSPYRLYSLSNFGSFLALLSYPFVVEPALRLRMQDLTWSWAYAAFVALAAWCSIRAMRLGDEPCAPAPDAQGSEFAGDAEIARPGVGRMLLWLGLAAAGSAFLLATTNQLCMDVAAVPFLWILPLSLYLLTFVICFDNPRWYDRRVFGLLLAIAAPSACWLIKQGLSPTVPVQSAIYAAVMFAGCMTCHGELTLSRPHPRHLTLFYLLVSAGGVVGGLFVALAAPIFFTGFWEYHVALGAACLVTLVAWCAGRAWRGSFSLTFWVWAVASFAQCALAILLADRTRAKEIAPLDLVILCCVYGLLQLLGWVWTAARGDRPRALAGIWSNVSAAQIAWIIAFSEWRHLKLIPASRYIWIVLGAAAVVAAGLFLADVGGRRLGETRRRQILATALQLLFLLSLLGSITGEMIGGTTSIVLIGLYPALLAAGFISKRGAGKSYMERGAWFWAPTAMALSVFLLSLHHLAREDWAKPIYASRNFYGVLRVTLRENEGGQYYLLQHGNIEHGLQYLDEHMRGEPTTYYGRDTGVGLAIRFHPRLSAADPSERTLRVGVVGLGVGAIAAFGQRGDYYRFYEINRDVAELSDLYFTYLRDSLADVKVVFGDARMAMERELAEDDPQQFDVLAIDAFNGDAIPIHLVTIECAEVYRRHLKPDGLLLFHISNRYLDLNPVVRALGERLGWRAVRIENEDDDEIGVYAATWIILTANEKFVSRPEIRRASRLWEKDEPKPLLWTDDFAGLWQVIER